MKTTAVNFKTDRITLALVWSPVSGHLNVSAIFTLILAQFLSTEQVLQTK